MTTLALIPGYAFNSSIWSSLVLTFPSSFNINSYNLSIDVDGFCYSVNKLLPKDSFVCGWSLGGLVAVKMCTLFPEKNYKLITIASSPCFRNVIDYQEFCTLKNLLFEDMDGFLTRLAYIISAPNGVHRLTKTLKKHMIKNQICLRTHLDYLLNTDLLEAYKSFNGPSLHILGLKDYIVSRETLQQWKINNKAEIYIEDSWGHFLLSNNNLNMVIQKWMIQNTK